MKKIFYLMLVALTMGMFTACDDDDENTPQINNPEPKEQWGKTLRGDNQTLLAFPDIYADYWEYTYSYKDQPLGKGNRRLRSKWLYDLHHSR